jgi:hypothetical protein
MCDAIEPPETTIVSRLPATATPCCGAGPPLHESDALNGPA